MFQESAHSSGRAHTAAHDIAVSRVSDGLSRRCRQQQGFLMQPESALAALGFTDFESLLYCELLRHGPQTGYRLANVVAKAPANTYHALKTLAQKGAVLVGDSASDSKTYRAVPPAELLASLGRAFEARREAALDCLNELRTPPAEERVYQFQTVTQVVDRAREMLSNAKEIALFDFFPEIHDLMIESIDAARLRGVVLAGIAYRADHASGTIPHNPDAEVSITELWPGLNLIIVADGSEMLMAQISRDRTQLLNGIWSDSCFLSASYHSALAAEIRLIAMRQNPLDPLKHISLFRSQPPGLRTMLARR